MLKFIRGLFGVKREMSAKEKNKAKVYAWREKNREKYNAYQRELMRERKDSA